MRAVLVNGCFDSLHAGHIHFLSEAKKLGGFLIVGLNSDESVRELKGEGRPMVAYFARANALYATSFVDAVVQSSGRDWRFYYNCDFVAYGRDVSAEKEEANRAALAALYPQSEIVFIPAAIGPSSSQIYAATLNQK